MSSANKTALLVLFCSVLFGVGLGVYLTKPAPSSFEEVLNQTNSAPILKQISQETNEQRRSPSSFSYAIEKVMQAQETPFRDEFSTSKQIQPLVDSATNKYENLKTLEHVFGSAPVEKELFNLVFLSALSSDYLGEEENKNYNASADFQYEVVQKIKNNPEVYEQAMEQVLDRMFHEKDNLDPSLRARATLNLTSFSARFLSSDQTQILNYLEKSNEELIGIVSNDNLTPAEKELWMTQYHGLVMQTFDDSKMKYDQTRTLMDQTADPNIKTAIRDRFIETHPEFSSAL